MTTTQQIPQPIFHEIALKAIEIYREIFKSNPEIWCWAPGRVNLIGEHVDYNDGYVLPMALPMGTVIVGSKNGSSSTADVVTCCEDSDKPNRVQFDTGNLKKGENPKWANYLKGVLYSFDQKVQGFNAVIISNVPVGAGLSSSAALEVSTVIFLEQITGKCVESSSKKALICQRAEHEFVGMPCGIMDQLISVAGKNDHALLIDCRSLETFQIPFDSKNYAVLICNSNVSHELSSSEYPTRRNECIRALELMKLKTYRDATENHLTALMHPDNEILLKRARHVITEIQRTYDAAEALKKHDYIKMGELMTKSHISLRDDFQVSCHELDVLVDSAINCDGVLGSRMTGGGFGGCTVTLLENTRNIIDNVMDKMKKNFMENFIENKSKLDFYVCIPSDGAIALQTML